MEIPYAQLSKEVLEAVIEEFITREGTDYGEVELSLADKVDQVREQLRRGEVDFTLTHVASLDADVNYAVQWITDWASPETQSVEMSSVHDDDYPKKYDTDLSTSGRRLLRAALQPEYDLLEELETLAVKPVR